MSKRGFRSTDGDSRVDSPAPMRALVKWLTGRDSGTYTPDVLLDWVVDYEECTPARSNVVEWRQPPKPKSGWPVFDAVVIAVSDDVDYLKRRMREEERKSQERSHETRVSTEGQGSPLRDINARTPNRLPPHLSSEEIRRLLRSLVSADPDPNSPICDENQVKVGEKLYLSKTQHMEAKLARTPTSMTMELVRAVFSSGRLRRSSYAGQKRNRNGETFQKPSLKRYRKMKDIQNFVNQRFPHFSQAAFGHAVNACTGKNVDKRPVRQLVDESDSDGDST